VPEETGTEDNWYSPVYRFMVSIFSYEICFAVLEE